MDIVLSQKDADWIANIIRGKLRDLEDSRKDALEEGEKRYNFCKQLANLAGIDPEDDIAGESLSDVKAKSIKTLEESCDKKREEYEKILLLMMTGSS